MAKFNRLVLQRSISEAYRASDRYIPCAIQQLDNMIETLEIFDATDLSELYEAAVVVIEEFSNDASIARWNKSNSRS